MNIFPVRKSGSPALFKVSRKSACRVGFTLIELLVVITIIAILSGMMSVVLSIAQKQSKKTVTRATLMKVDQAIRLFRTDTGAYPFQTDLSNAHVDPTKWTNNLGFRLAWKPLNDADRTAYRDKLQTDLTAIHACFVFKTGKKVGLPGGDGTHAFRCGDYYYPADANFLTNLLMKPGSLKVPDGDFAIEDGDAANYIIPGWDSNSLSGTTLALTRMADEISSLRYLSGQLPVEAPTGFDPADPIDKALRPNLDARYTTLHFSAPFVGTTYGTGGTHYTAYRYVPYNKRGAIADDSRGPVLTTAAAQAKGWRAEYLTDSLKLQTATGTAGEIDPTGTAILDAYRRPLVYVCTFTPGARGFSYAMGGNPIDEGDYGMRPFSRLATSLMASDLRTTAAPTYVMEFELWSPGPDGLFAAQRDDAGNRDNISLLPYTKDLR